MPCNAPLDGWKAKEKTARGKRAVTFRLHEGLIDLPVSVPCGKCHGCRLDKSREWAMRCSHEAQLHDENSFITLTYNDEHLPRTKDGTPTLNPDNYVRFMKRLRERTPHRISFFHCGEYGDRDNRPHHHAILFGRGFADMYFWRKSGHYNLYRSEELETLWTFGHSEIGEASFESAGYIARYQLKEHTPIDGVHPPYLTMSRRPGIGKRWIEQFQDDVYPDDRVVVQGGTAYKPPRYYDQQIERNNPRLFESIQARRQDKLTEEQKSGLRNTARELILRSKSKQRRRPL